MSLVMFKRFRPGLVKPATEKQGTLVRETVSRMIDVLTRAGCTVDLKADCKLIGLFDRYRIEQVRMNLLSNSIKFAGRKPIHVRVEPKEHGATVQIELWIRDFGPGIPEGNW